MHQLIEENRTVFIVTIVLLASTWITLLLRLIVRGAILRSLGWDDATLFISALFFTALGGVTLNACYVTIGSGPLQPAVVLGLVTALFTSLTLYIITTAILKISLGFFFMRFLVTRWHRRLVIVSISLFTIYSVAFFIAVYATFGSDPVRLSQRIINKTCAGTSCGSWHIIGPMTYLGGVFNSLIDVVFAVLPVLFIRSTNLPLRAKLSTCALLGMGVISGIASMVRIPYISGLNLNHSLYPSTAYVCASIVEVALAISTLSCDALRPLFVRRSGRQRLVSVSSASAATALESDHALVLTVGSREQSGMCNDKANGTDVSTKELDAKDLGVE